MYIETVAKGRKTMEKELVRLVAKSPEVIREIYGDLAKPNVQQVGKSLETVIGLGNTILWPIQMLNERSRIVLETNLEKYRKKLEDTSKDEICTVVPELDVPIAEKLSYVTNNVISDLYIELLSKASIKKTVDVAHPSFINVIDNLSPDEAAFLSSIRNASSIPFIQVRLQELSENKWITLHPLLIQLRFQSEVMYPNNLPAYLSNLEGLGILDIRDDIYVDNKGAYDELEELGNLNYKKMTKSIKDRKLVFHKGKIQKTSFGELFMNACSTSEKR